MHATERDSHMCDTDALNMLLRGELAAVETYTRAVTKFDDQQVIADLQKVRDEHERAVRALRDRVVMFGGAPAEGTGPWGTFAASVTGGAKVLGPATALAVLRQGEEHGVSEYESALENGDIHPDCHRLIRTDLLPASRKHVVELNRMIGGMSA